MQAHIDDALQPHDPPHILLRATADHRNESRLPRNCLEVARLQARTKHLKVRVRLIRTRNPGKAIVEEARERHSDLIYIDTQHAPSDERLLKKPETRQKVAEGLYRGVESYLQSLNSLTYNQPKAAPANR